MFLTHQKVQVNRTLHTTTNVTTLSLGQLRVGILVLIHHRRVRVLKLHARATRLVLNQNRIDTRLVDVADRELPRHLLIRNPFLIKTFNHSVTGVDMPVKHQRLHHIVAVENVNQRIQTCLVAVNPVNNLLPVIGNRVKRTFTIRLTQRQQIVGQRRPRLHLVQVIDHVRHVRVHTRHVRGVNNVSQLAHKRRIVRPDMRINSTIAVVDVGLVVLVETVFQTRLVVEPGLVGKITVEHEVANPVDNVVVGQRRSR